MRKGSRVTTAWGGQGVIQRITKDGKRADVAWSTETSTWIQRVPADILIIYKEAKPNAQTT